MGGDNLKTGDPLVEREVVTSPTLEPSIGMFTALLFTATKRHDLILNILLV